MDSLCGGTGFGSAADEIAVGVGVDEDLKAAGGGGAFEGATEAVSAFGEEERVAGLIPKRAMAAAVEPTGAAAAFGAVVIGLGTGAVAGFGAATRDVLNAGGCEELLEEPRLPEEGVVSNPAKGSGGS